MSTHAIFAKRRGAVAATAALALAACTSPASALSRPAGCHEPRPAVRSTEILTSGFRYLPGDDACGIPRLAVTRGSRLMYTNLDFAAHDVRSFALRRGSDEPLFTSELTRYLGRGEVIGVAALRAGTYGFYCTIHPPRQSGGGMHGALVVETVRR